VPARTDFTEGSTRLRNPGLSASLPRPRPGDLSRPHVAFLRRTTIRFSLPEAASLRLSIWMCPDGKWRGSSIGRWRAAIKRFMYASFALLALAFALRIGSSTAHSFGLDCIEAVTFTGPNTFAVVVDGAVQLWRPSGLHEEFPPLPSGSAAAAIYIDGIGSPWVMMRNGKLYQWGPSPSWELRQDVGCGFTAVFPIDLGSDQASVHAVAGRRLST
jgi:hypothetical protein